MRQECLQPVDVEFQSSKVDFEIVLGIFSTLCYTDRFMLSWFCDIYTTISLHCLKIIDKHQNGKKNVFYT